MKLIAITMVLVFVAFKVCLSVVQMRMTDEPQKAVYSLMWAVLALMALFMVSIFKYFVFLR